MDETNSESDFDTAATSGRGRKRRTVDYSEEPPKRGRGGGIGSRGGRGRGRGRGRGSGSGSSLISTSDVGSESDLYALVKNGRMTLQEIADQWIEGYQKNRDVAVTDLAQFFISSCGCKGRVSRALVVASKYPDLIRHMTEEFDEESGDYPLVSAGPQWKKFRQSLCDFIQVLIKQCQFTIIYDQHMMDHVISLLPVLADSQVRAFRHTGTLAAMKLMTALVDIAAQLIHNMENINRQYETEKMKQRRAASERVEVLLAKKTEYEQNLDEIKNMLAYVFKSVFVHRYRDVLPEIRSICVSELGVWMVKYSTMFLEDSYLKYIGWTLYDKVGEVRLKCLQTLLPLYEDEDLGGRMELFTNKFKERVVTMALDREAEVSVCAVKLVTYLYKHYRDVLSNKDCESIYELVFAAHRPLATAAGEFLNVRLFFPDEAAVRDLRTKKGKQRSINTPLIRDLILFFIESDLHQHAAYLVDALIDSNEMLKDWECMTDLLLEEPGRDEKALDDREEKILIEITTCAVKQAATSEPPVGRYHPKKQYITQKEQKQVYDDRVKLTEHFIVSLPLLLQKYIADPEKIANLLQIPQFFELEIYTTMRLEKHLEALLRCIEEVLDKHTDEEVLLACSKTYESLCGEQLGIQQRCETAKSKLIDALVIQLRQKIQQFHSDFEDLDEEDLASIMATVKKVEVLNQCHDLSQWDLWDLFYNIIQPPEDDNRAIPNEMAVRALKCCFLSTVWDLKRLDDAVADKTKVDKLKTRVKILIGACRELMTRDAATLRETAFLSVCDLLMYFSWALGDRNKSLAALVYEPEIELESFLVAFVHDYVFIEAEEEEMDDQTQIEVLHRRRNLLASFCKLVWNRVVQVKTAAEVFRQYVKFFPDYGDIIKTTITKCREDNKVKCARALASALTNQFTILKEEAENGVLDPQTDEFAALRELAKRFALTFGPDPLRSREAVASLHKHGKIFGGECIDFAVHGDRHSKDTRIPPPNLAFLEILMELTNKLIKQDKRVVLQYLDRHISCPKDAAASWQPLNLYRNSLLQGEDMPPPQIPAVGSTGKRSRGRPPRVSSAITDVSGQFVPQAHSTAVRQTTKRLRLDSDQTSDAGSERDFHDAGQRSGSIPPATPSFLG